MKIKLELNVLDDGRIFLNFWENIHGKDVVCEVRGGLLFHVNEEGETTVLTRSIGNFIEKVIENSKQGQP